MLDKCVIKVDNLKKDFYLPHQKNDSVKLKVTQIFKEKDKSVNMYHALRGVSFEINKGDFFGILGRNGSGKSTLLKILASIYTPTRGSVKVKGKLVPFIELGVGFNGELTGRENIYLNGAMLGFSRKEIDERYDKIVEFAELENFMDQKLKNYSSGMKVRLAFSVAIQADADILLLDEVLAVGDADFQRKCYNYFKSLKEQKKTIVFVTHNMNAAKEYCNRAILIQDGVITHEGSADEIADEYLKMFNPRQSSLKKNNSVKRWGNGDVSVSDIKVEVSHQQVEVICELQAGDYAAKGIVFGFRIKDSDGKVIAGANNLNVEGAQEMNFRENEKKTLYFKMLNIFGDKTYSVSATVRLSDGVTICDNWEDATSFNTTRAGVYYPVVCPAKLTIKK